jgi:signal transduction histidine kinase
VTRRLLLSYMGMALLVLVVLETPLALLAQHHERGLSVSQAEREATGVAAVVAEDVEENRVAALSATVSSYQARTGGEVSVFRAGGTLVTSSKPDRDEASEQHRLISLALRGSPAGTFASDEGEDAAVAAVPVTTESKVIGAVLLGVPADSTTDRIHAIWAALAALAFGVLVISALAGVLLARSLSSPLARLENAVARLGEGDLTARASVDHGPPQVRALAGRFNKMATRLTELLEAQNRFVADASHQLRSPLTALRLRLENLEATSGDSAAPGIAAVGREVQRLSRLVDGLLTLSRAGDAEPQRTTLHVDELIDERCDAWAALAEERRVELRPEVLVERPCEAEMVPGDLDQILDNLLANALEVSPEGKRITVRLAAERGAVGLHVIDEGPGLSSEGRLRAFDRFWQGPGSNGGHSGLGLAIVRQLASRNNATVDLEQSDPVGLDAVVHLRANAEPTTARR